MTCGSTFCRTARSVAALGAAALSVSLLGCGQPEPAKPAAPTISDKVQAIQDDPKLSPTQKAMAVDRLAHSEAQNILSGGALGQGK